MWALAEKVFFLIKMVTEDSGKMRRKNERILPGGMFLAFKRGSGEDEASLKGVEVT